MTFKNLQNLEIFNSFFEKYGDKINCLLDANDQTEILVIDSTHSSNAVITAIKRMPPWIPANQNGRAVESIKEIIVNFDIEGVNISK
ncbi:energy transducer TonB [Ferruginibacter lapsinanis]|uniref:energy transducer TonB n=1 Tax=Ferruginibacter lapsinanis TaxID=563172 RepID=UPI001E4FFFE9|nr:energy transducer TonB [Ferruginibacter lapsinanis]UEG50778.1 energy transducer TonB [Ferruginibacter lapsinanis]